MHLNPFHKVHKGRHRVSQRFRSKLPIRELLVTRQLFLQIYFLPQRHEDTKVHKGCGVNYAAVNCEPLTVNLSPFSAKFHIIHGNVR